MKTYSFKKTLLKGGQYLLYYGVPYVVARYVLKDPELTSLISGTIVTMISNYLKNRPKERK